MNGIKQNRVIGMAGIAFLLAALVMVAGCNLDSGEYEGPVQGNVLGTVISQNGGPLAGAQVFVGDLIATTDELGRFRLEGVSPAKRIRLELEAEGFLRTYAFTEIKAWETTNVSVTMVPFGRPHAFVAEEGIRLMERRPEGTYYVEIPPNGVVDATGTLVSGPVEVHISPISRNGSPGDLTGIVYQDGLPHVVPLISYKMTDITLTQPGDDERYDPAAQWGKKFNLAPNVRAKVELPLPRELPAAQVPPVGKQILWWWWDPQVGHWVQDAIGQVKTSIDGSARLAWQAEWTHFSRHGVLMPKQTGLDLAPDRSLAAEREVLVANVDDPPEPTLTCVEGLVKDKLDYPIQGAEIWVEGQNIQTRTRFQSDQDGIYKVGPVVVGSTIEIIARVMVEGKPVEGSVTYTVRGPGQSQGFALDLETAICEEGPDIEIEVCSAGGDIVAISWKMGGDGAGASIVDEANFVEGAVAQFYEPYGEVEFCEPKLDRIETDSCMLLSSSEIIGLDMRDPVALDAGAWVSLAGMGGNATLPRSQGGAEFNLAGLTLDESDIFYRYDNNDSNQAFGAGTYTIQAAGAQPGVPPFTEADALTMPQRLQLTGDPEPVVTRGQSLPLTWTTANDPETKVAIIILPTNNARSGIACMVVDDGAFTVPASALADLPAGQNETLLMVMRTRKGQFRLPQGTIARTRGMTGLMFVNTIEGDGNCGDGNLDLGELCDANCPDGCEDGDACTQDKLEGSPATCDAVCVFEQIDTCTDNDGCCPANCNYTNDSDCMATCGNGVLEGGEICDGDCPESCDDANACTIDEMSGTAESCNTMCAYRFISVCQDGDGCCPAGCNNEEDSDCDYVCGDGFVENGELCDGNCPVSCDDGNACTTDVLNGSAASCDASCANLLIVECIDGDGCCAAGCKADNDSDCSGSCGNGQLEGGELCDGNCPVDCEDGDSCTVDQLSGSPDTCNAVCQHFDVDVCDDNDGCCPQGCIEAGDADCRNDQSWVELTDPIEGQPVENPVAFRAAASQDVVRVQYLVDGMVFIGASTDPAAGFELVHEFHSFGDKQVLVTAFDENGNKVAEDEALIHVSEQVVAATCQGAAEAALIPPAVCDGAGGLTTTIKAPNQLYATSWFGAYRGVDGSVQLDPADNGLFACGSMGYCAAGLSGPECQADIMWFAASADRFGCGARIRLTDCESGKSVVLAVLDRGPHCQDVEQACGAPVLDMSRPAMEYLFDGQLYGGFDHQKVLVEEVSASTPLGPAF